MSAQTARSLDDRVQFAIHSRGLCSRTPCCAFCRMAVPQIPAAELPLVRAALSGRRTKA